MDELDEAILDFLRALGTPSGNPVVESPRLIWYNLDHVRGMIDVDPSTVSRHMSRLSEDGLLENKDENRGYYAITDLGIRYAEGDLTDEEFEDLRDRRTS